MYALTLREAPPGAREESVTASCSQDEGVTLVGGPLAAALSPLSWRKLMTVRRRARARGRGSGRGLAASAQPRQFPFRLPLRPPAPHR